MTKLHQSVVSADATAGLHPAAGTGQPPAAPGALAPMTAALQAAAGSKKQRPGKAAGKARIGLAKAHLADDDQDAAAATSGAASTGDSTAPAPAADNGGHGSSHFAPYLLGGLAVIAGGAALAAGGGKGSSAPATPPPAPVPPATPTLALGSDSGRSASDGITNQGAITVSGLVSGAKWEYSTDSGATWKSGSGTAFTLPDGTYAAGTVQVRQTDSAGTVSSAGKLAAAVTVDTAVAAPTIDAVAGDDVLTIAEASATGGVTVSGKAEANAKVELAWRISGTDQVATAIATADDKGVWQWTFKGSAIPDAHKLLTTTLTATATDAAGNVSSVTTRTITTDPGVTVQGMITAGGVIAGNDLTVNLYSGSGQLLAAGVKVAADGTFQASYLPLVKGDVLVAVLANGPAADYADEASGLPTNLNSRLFAAAVAGDHVATLNVNPLTTLAARLLGLGSDGKGGLTGTADAGATSSAYQAVAKAFGLAANDLAALAPEVIPASGYPAGTTLTTAQQAGLLLAALSGLDARNGGDSQKTLDSLAEVLGAAGSTGLGEAGVLALVAGAQQASGKLGTALISLLAAHLAAAAGGPALTIGTVAGDDVINAAEGSRLTITGTVADGATAVTLALGSATVQASIDSTTGTWTYQLTADDLAALGADGPLLIKATATLADGSSATAQRAVLHETSAPAPATIETVLGNDRLGLQDAASDVTVKGTAEAWSSVAVQWNGVSHVVSADGSGHWQATFTSGELPRADGPAPITASVTDRFGNPAATLASHVVTVDLHKPAAPTITTPGLYGLLSPSAIKAGVTVSGTGEIGASVKVGWDADHSHAVTVKDDGTWSWKFDAADLPQSGSVVFTATQTDAARNTSDAAKTDPVLLVRSAAGPVLAPVAGGDGVNLAEASNGFQVCGVAAPNSLLTIVWDGDYAKTVTADANGYWKVDYGLADLPIDGTHALTVSGTDGNNVPLKTTTVKVTIDTAPPLAPTIAPIAVDNQVNLTEKNAGVVISGTASETGVQAWVTWGGTTHKVDIDPTDKSWKASFLAKEVPADGDTKVMVKIVDAAGNESPTVESKVLVLTAVPAAPTLKLNGDTGPDASSPLSAGSDTDGKTSNSRIDVSNLVAGKWEYSIKGGSWTLGEGTSFSLDDGSYREGDIRVRQTDVAGNISAAASLGPLIIHTTAPSVSVSEIAKDGIINAAERAQGVTISFNVDNASPDIPVAVTLTWRTVGDAPVAIGQPVTLTVTDTRKHEVLFTADQIPTGYKATELVVTAVDAVGNAPDPQTIDIQISTTPPPSPTVSLAEDSGAGGDGITNKNTMTVGNVPDAPAPNEGWQYKIKDGSWQDGVGTAFELADGTYDAGSIQVRRVDAAGNFSDPVSYGSRLIIDTITADPLIDPVGLRDVINLAAQQNGFTLTGTAELGATVTVIVNGRTYTATAEATSPPLADGRGRWSVPVAGNIWPTDNQTHEVTVTAKDVAGNESATVTRQYTVDTSQPANPTIDRLAHGNAVTAAERANGVTFSGTTDAGTTVKVTFNGQTLDARVDGTHWSLSLNSAQIPADIAEATVQVAAFNANQNSSDAVQSTVVIDTTTPAPTITELTSPTTFIKSSSLATGLALSGQAEAGAIVTLTLNGQSISATANGSGQWSAKFAGWQIPGDGPTTIAAVAVDKYGNTSSLQSYPVRVDTAAPTQLTIGRIGNGFVRAGETFTIKGSATVGAQVRVTVDGVSDIVSPTVGPNGEWTVQVSNYAGGQTSDKAFTVSAVVVDAAGNEGPRLTETVQLLGTAHTGVAIGLVGGDDWVNSTEIANGIRIIGYATPDSMVKIRLDDAHTYFARASKTGLWTLSVGPDLPDGQYLVAEGQRRLEVSEALADGSYSVPVTRTYTVDLHAPSGPTIDTVAGTALAPASSSGFTVSAQAKQTGHVDVVGHADANAAVHVKWGGAEQFVTANETGVWTATFSASELPASGDSTITAVATDQAGNVGTASQTAVTIDTAITADADTHIATGVGFGDELKGTNSDDTLIIPDLTFRSINGNDGFDVLQLGSGVSNATLDLTHLAVGRLQNIEKIDLTGGRANHLIVDAASIQAETGPANALYVTGVAGERVTAFGFVKSETTQSDGDLTYTLYTSGEAKLWVDNRIDQVVL